MSTKSTSTTYRYISDPGHAWVEVPIAEVKRLGLKPSAYSYQNDGMAYLEEDCDAGDFVEAKKRLGEAYRFDEVYQEDTPIRGYARFA